MWRATGIDFEESEEFAARRERRYHGSNRWPKGHGVPSRGGSSWQSLVRGAGTIESEFLNGEVVQIGRLLGIPAPYNEVLWRRAEQMARNRTAPGHHTVAELTREAESATEPSSFTGLQ